MRMVRRWVNRTTQTLAHWWGNWLAIWMGVCESTDCSYRNIEIFPSPEAEERSQTTEHSNDN